MRKITIIVFVFLVIIGSVEAQTTPVKILIRGTGLNRNAARVFKVGDQNVYNTASGRGLRLTILNKSDQSIVSDNSYDTYGASSASESLATVLNSVTKDQLGIITSFDAWEGNVTTNLDNAFLRIGLTIAMATPRGGYRRPYAAIFEGASGGRPTSKAIEVSYPGLSDMPYAEIRGFLIDGSFVATGSQNNALMNPQGDGVGALVDYRGYVGIGTATPGHKLDVAGTIRAEEILVEANGNTADFVFEEDYDLKDLSEVESFIKTNKHLPEIPSAAQMEEQGVNLAKMNKLLLQKVEELTLYQIAKNKEVQELKEARKKEQGERKKLEKALSKEQSARSEMEARLARLEALMLEINPQ